MEVATKRPSAGKNTGLVLVPCLLTEAISGGVDFGGPWVLFVTTDEFSVRVTKITSRIGVS